MSESFAELLEESLANQQIKQGSILTATVVDVNQDVVIVHAGLKSEAVISTDQFLNERGEIEVQIGDEVEVADGGERMSAEEWCRLAQRAGVAPRASCPATRRAGPGAPRA